MNNKELEFQNLRIHYGVLYGITKKKTFKGFKTNLGEIEEKEWINRAENLISKYNEEHITQSLIEYLRDEYVWLKDISEDEIRLEALERHISRLF